MNDADALVSLADVAEMAGVSRPAVSNWRRRNPDFPSPVAETGATSLFRLGDLRLWMADHGKRLDVRSVDQLVWSALNPARGVVLPEEAAQAGMILLGYLALALRLDKTVPSALQAAIADYDQQALGKLLTRLDEQAGQLGLGELFPAKIATTWSSASRSFLGKVLDLALEHGVSEAFEALIAAAGRGSRGKSEHTTPSSVADLIMSIAAPVRGVVIDPACGYGTLLLAASKAVTTQLTLIGKDVSSDACHITRLRMFVHGLTADVSLGDTLQARTLFDDVTLMDAIEADLIMADPPFAMSWHPELADTKRMPYGVPPSTRGDMAWLQDGISRLRPSGVAMFVLGHGTVFRGGTEGEIRRRLIESRCIRAVVALPPALYPTTSIPTSLWIVSKPRQPGEERPGGDSVLLIDASQLGNRRRSQTELTRPDIAAITDCFRAWHTRGQLSAEGGVRAAAVPVESLLAGDGNLNPARWIEDPADDPEQRLERVAAAEHELRAASARFCEASFSVPPLAPGRAGPPEDSWAIRKVTDLAKLIRPRRIDPDLIGTGDTPLIRTSDIGPDLAVTPGSLVDPGLVTGRVEFTQPGDIVVVADGTKPRAAVDHRGGAVVSAPLQVVRPRPGSIDPVILAALITSIGPRYAVGTTVGHLDLTALEVPCPDPGTARWLSQTLETLGKQRREALAALRALDELRTELVEGLGSEAIRLESHTPGEEGHRW
jgi:type I restriction-modification system DNA methylase subunit/predicted DNA-binding transcriptional regulator AlpA